MAQSLVLHGRALHVTHAVTRNEAAKLKDEGERSREKADKRNLYLLREGGECLIDRWSRREIETNYPSDLPEQSRCRYSQPI